MNLARALGVALLLAFGGACSKAPEPTADAAAPPAEVPKNVAPAKPAPPPLSAEDLRLIEADPKDLTLEERRKRAYALRRKIMQNPDSPAARTLEDLASAARSGQLDGQAGGTVFHLPGTKPTGGAPPAGVRPHETSSGDADQAH